jgi:hypothetical protein
LRHCKKAVNEDGSAEAIERVTNFLLNPKCPAPLRVEVAHLLNSAEQLSLEVAAKLLGANQPTMLRLLSAGTLLAAKEDLRAIEVVREIGRQPNREIALAAGAIVQRYLGVDMGLPMGGQLPPLNSRLAAEVTRKVLEWATDEPSVQEPASIPG